MNAVTATSNYPQVISASVHEQDSPAAAGPRIRLNGYVVIFSLTSILALATASECRSVTHLPSLVYGLVLWGWWGTVAAILWKLGQSFPASASFSSKTVSFHALAGLSLGVLHLLLLWSLGFTALGWQGTETARSEWQRLLNVNRFGIELLIYGFVFGITGIVQYHIRAQRDALKAMELQRQLSVAHLRALQMQLEPHFLFNTLNAITTLVELGRQKQATEMLTHLNAILKSTLARTTPEKIPLSKELEMIESYLAIEQVRFADRLQIEIKVDSSALDGLVPSFLLQPIVENAIRHGIARCENDGMIEASARRDGGSLHLRIRDTGPSATDRSQNGHGIGLRNTRERLTHFYQDAFAMNARPLDTGGFEVAITIPYERPER
jgi:Putative regulator of cell autolysis